MTKEKDKLDRKNENAGNNDDDSRNNDAGEFRDIDNAMNGVDTDDSLDEISAKPSKMSKVNL